MPFKKGEGGRRKGSLNKVSPELRKLMEEVTERSLKIVFNAPHLELNDAIKILSVTLKHHIPTLRQVDTTIDISSELESQISEMSRSELLDIAHILKSALDEKDRAMA